MANRSHRAPAEARRLARSSPRRSVDASSVADFVAILLLSCVLRAVIVDSYHTTSYLNVVVPSSSSPPSRTSSVSVRHHHHRESVGSVSRPINEITKRHQSATGLFAVRRSGGGAGLRPAAISLMESGKQLAISGERIIEWTDAVNLYGGGISSAGAQIRNAGDSVAQAAASCRFQTGQELVSDELRTAADCLVEAVSKFQFAVQEADIDQQHELKRVVEACVPLTQRTSAALERAGAGILQNQPLNAVGRCWVEAGDALVEMSACLAQLASVEALPSGMDAQKKGEARATADDAARRMQTAGAKMVEAGRELQPKAATTDAKPAGKRWLKGGGA